MTNALEKLLKEFKPDLIYTHLIRMAEYLKHRKEYKRILALQISQTLNYRRMISHIDSPFYRLLYGLEYRKVRRYEPAVMKDFNSCLLISKYDKESLDGHASIDNVFYSPHGVDVEYYTRDPKIPYENNAILFCGVLETPTNMDAVLYFYNDIYPLIKEKITDVKLYLLGKNPPKCLIDIAKSDSSVVLPGFVKDIRPYYSKVRVGIDPIRIGAGLQNKLLVGMSMGQAMVSSSVANEGIAGENGKQLVIADTPISFASSVIDLLNNPCNAERIGIDARRYIEEKWTWEYYFKQLETHFENLLS
jgi:glycosyltransferase involved in cell wall biosynthesis